MLRGTVEEQARTIQTLQSDGRSRYLDLDSRISALSTQPPATAILAPLNRPWIRRLNWPESCGFER